MRFLDSVTVTHDIYRVALDVRHDGDHLRIIARNVTEHTLPASMRLRLMLDQTWGDRLVDAEVSGALVVRSNGQVGIVIDLSDFGAYETRIAHITCAQDEGDWVTRAELLLHAEDEPLFTVHPLEGLDFPASVRVSSHEDDEHRVHVDIEILGEKIPAELTYRHRLLIGFPGADITDDDGNLMVDLSSTSGQEHANLLALMTPDTTLIGFGYMVNLEDLRRDGRVAYTMTHPVGVSVCSQWFDQPTCAVVAVA